jgi:hypothetical protein
MKTESRRVLDHGFVLTEQELRRLVDTAAQQMHRARADQVPETSFHVKFKSGEVVEKLLLEDVLGLENAGSRQIVHLGMEMKGKPGWEQFAIKIGFTNIRAEVGEYRPILYVVTGEDRDWVLVTASELDDRIAKCRCFNWSRASWSVRSGLVFPLFMALFMLLSLGGFLYTTARRGQVADRIEAKWKDGTLRDPIEAIILTEKAREAREAFTWQRIVGWMVVIPLGGTSVVLLSGVFLYYLYPGYVFCWGDYVKLYERRVAVRRYVVWGIIVTLCLSVVAGMIANRLSR